jgi:hypothetical protein
MKHVKPKSKKFVYILKSSSEHLEGMAMSFKSVDRASADNEARAKSLALGHDTKAVFFKEM